MNQVDQHGTRSRYVSRGCRCRRCKQANADYQTDRNRRIANGTWLFAYDPITDTYTVPVGPPHRGTRSKGDC